MKTKFSDFLNESKQITGDMKRFLGKIYLFEVMPNIYSVNVKDDWARALIFLRFQEYYENVNPKYQRKQFDIHDFMRWYRDDFQKRDVFSYGDDWDGFNIPSDVLEECAKGVTEPNNYDKIIFSIIDAIHKNGSEKYYLIGTDVGSNSEELLKHELAHGLYYSNSEYKKLMNKLVDDLPPKFRNLMSKYLMEIGYAKSVIKDEIQAYLSTCDKDEVEGEFTDGYELVDFGMSYRKNIKPFHTILNRFYKDMYKEPYYIRVDYSKYIDF